MNRVLVTGASGFVGSHIVRVLAAEGISVRCLVRGKSRLDFIKQYHPELVIGDITEPATLSKALQGVDGIVHCAGLINATTFRQYIKVNQEGSQNLYEACKKTSTDLKSIVHISSLGALGPSINNELVTEEREPQPISYYGESKLGGQKVAESCMQELPITILIPTAVYGPFDIDFLAYFKFIKKRIMPFVGGKTRYVSLIYAKDLAQAVFKSLVNTNAIGKKFLVEDGAIQTWESIAQTICKAMEKDPVRIHIPVSIAKGVAFFMDLVSIVSGRAQLLNSQKVRELLQPAWICSSARIRSELGFQPRYDLEKGIRETLEWYQRNNWI